VKVYAIFPAFELYGRDEPAERTHAAITLIVAMVIAALRRDGDVFHYAVDWRDPGAAPLRGQWSGDVATPHVMPFTDDDDLRSAIGRAVDPNIVGWCMIRSIATCRAVTFGYDGQAFVCLRHADAPPVSPDETLATVEPRPDMLTETDVFDGWLPEYA
jgi:hypothetical protein